MRTLRLYGWKENFGDALNYWLWPKLLPEIIEGDDALLLGIGTVLSTKVPDFPERKIVFGAGAGNDPIPRIDEKWMILGVRGPWTAGKLGLSADLVISDPALLVRSQFHDAAAKRHQVSYMPHIISVASSDEWRHIATELEFNFIDPRDGIDDVLLQIRESETLITEAMHGAIVADAFRVPWIRVQGGDLHAPTSKWLDWTASLGIAHESHQIPFLWRRAGEERTFRGRLSRVTARERLRWIRRTARPLLSTNARSNEAYDRQMRKVGELREWLKT
jgi:succinoglycan biosynthesis protein ExoV